MVAYLEIAAHSAYDMFSKYKYLIVSLVFFPRQFLEWEILSGCAFSRSLPTYTFLLLFYLINVLVSTFMVL